MRVTYEAKQNKPIIRPQPSLPCAPDCKSQSYRHCAQGGENDANGNNAASVNVSHFGGIELLMTKHSTELLPIAKTREPKVSCSRGYPE